MSFIVGILTFALIVNCGVLVLLILVQLPKKDAGAGLAFGGGAADALFGAGSGNALTKITKWAAVVFMLLSVFLGSLEIKINTGGQSEFEQAVGSLQQTQAAPRLSPAAPQNAPASSSSAGSTAPVLPLPTTTTAPTSPSGK
jgi:preprotein translocase subunit SecG